MREWDPIFARRSSVEEFDALALETFRFQSERRRPYRAYLDVLGVDPQRVERVEQIPFLPVELFKSCEIYCGEQLAEVIFSSSSTTGQTPSRHAVAYRALYERAFTEAFVHFYGDPTQSAIFALLPSYLEREGSSLIYMVDRLIAQGGGGFYLHNHEQLLCDLRAHKGRKILLGVSYALWDLAEAYPEALSDTIVMETGGMKGHRRELPREEFHRLLCEAFSVEKIHSEYGMAEMLSQAYSRGGGIFEAPPSVRVVIRDPQDPMAYLPAGRVGGVNVIDLANRYSCSFLQTQDRGVVAEDGTFQILGRLSGSEIRGCNLLVQQDLL